VTGAGQPFTVVDNIAPDWLSSAGYRGARAIPGVWRATLLLADIIGGLPWRAYRQRAGQPPVRLGVSRDWGPDHLDSLGGDGVDRGRALPGGNDRFPATDLQLFGDRLPAARPDQGAVDQD
jgi:hypothetical protein